MEPTLRGHVYIFSGLILTLTGLLGFGWPYTLILGTAVLVSAYLLYSLARGYEDAILTLVVSRRLGKTRAVEGEEVLVFLRAVDTSGRGIPLLTVADDLPSRVAAEPEESMITLSLPPKASREAMYRLKAYFGSHLFRGAIITGNDAFGLFAATRYVEEPGALRVIPCYSGIVESIFQSSMPWPGETSRFRRRGLGVEFYELRDYEPGDDPRKIVWSATARAGRLVVREDEAETRSRIMLFADLSQEMWLGTPGETSADHVARAAASIAAYSARMGDSVGFVIYLGDRWFIHHPQRGARVAEMLAERLSMVSPELAKPRIRFAQALDEALRTSGAELLLVLTGVGAFRESQVRRLVESLPHAARRLLLISILPTVKDQVSRAIAFFEKRHYMDSVRRLERAGIRAILVEGWGWIEAVRTMLAEVEAS